MLRALGREGGKKNLIALRVFASENRGGETMSRGKSDAKLFSKVTTGDYMRITPAVNGGPKGNKHLHLNRAPYPLARSRARLSTKASLLAGL